MTKKEFTYLQENPDKFLNADFIYIRFFNCDIPINSAKIIRSKNINTPNPDIEYENYNFNLYVSDKVVDVEFDNDTIILKTKINHAYLDREDRKIKKCLVGEMVTNSFLRKDIKSIDIRNYEIK